MIYFNIFFGWFLFACETTRDFKSSESLSIIFQSKTLFQKVFDLDSPVSFYKLEIMGMFVGVQSSLEGTVAGQTIQVPECFVNH